MKWLILAIAVSSCSAAPQSASSIYWSDGDSGRIDGMDFRLADVDAPETGGVEATIGGAKCERERVLGLDAKAFMVELTRGADLDITQREGEDRYGRIIVNISADGQDVAEAGLQAGMLKPWPHDGSRPLADKPDWCL